LHAILDCMLAPPVIPRALPLRRLMLAGLLIALLAALGSAAYLLRAERWSGVWQRTPVELVRYAERRLDGHPRLQRVFSPALQMWRRAQQPEPPASLPTLGKGQQVRALGAAGYDAAGRPQPLSAVASAAAPVAPSVRITDVQQLDAALTAARSGQVLQLEPGRYAVATTLHTGHAGTAALPIVVRAARPGSVELVVTALQGIVVDQPYWVFENLDWRGACANHDDCEHAYHVVGPARGTVILNNRIADFNAHLKINGQDGGWPDDGLVQFTSFVNSAGRRTGAPVNAVDSVGANGWQVLDNSVEAAIKLGGNGISYGLCIKGAGRGVVIERNRVVCTPDRLAQAGLRVGISLGCGGSAPQFCRDGRCNVELFDGVVANNVVAHCNDFGIDLLLAQRAQVLHNTLVNTEGIDARGASTRADVIGNLVEGRIRARDGAGLMEQDNLAVGALDALLAAPLALDLRWNEASNRARATPETARDFCGRPRPPFSPPGATVQARCDAAPAR
jgi:hypothetical protein